MSEGYRCEGGTKEKSYIGHGRSGIHRGGRHCGPPHSHRGNMCEVADIVGQLTHTEGICVRWQILWAMLHQRCLGAGDADLHPDDAHLPFLPQGQAQGQKVMASAGSICIMSPDT